MQYSPPNQKDFTFQKHYSIQEQRTAFLRSVYLWLMDGFAVAALGAYVSFATLPSVAPFMGNGFVWILFIAQIGAVFFAQAVSRKKPLNIFAYGLFTIISGYVAGLICMVY